MGQGKEGYEQLRLAAREEISLGLAMGHRPSAIGRRVGYSCATVSRERRRHHIAGVGYRASWAQRQADDASRRKGRRRKLVEGGALWAEVCRRLITGLSPAQVSRTLKRDFADNHAMQVSHETIYQALYVLPRNALKALLVQEGLRQHHEKRRPQSRLTTAAPKVRLAGGVSIDERPVEVDDRTVPGHWEGDLIKGEKNRSEVGVLLERQTRRLVLARLTDAKAATVRQAFESAFKMMPPSLVKTMTYDQGIEMAEHAVLARHANIRVYFADKHSPWQKGAIEHANGLLRQYLPKGTSLAGYSQEQLDAIADKINNRPRETLGWRTPNEAWAEIVSQNVALNS